MKKRISNLSILYIENDFKLQNEVCTHLRKIFSKVIQVNDGQEGLIEYKKNKPDIVLTDLDFKNINAFEMVVEMQDFNSDISIIVLSKRNDDFDLLETLDLGLVALLEKPLNFNSLNKALQKIILQKPNNSKIQNKVLSQTTESMKTIEKPTIDEKIEKSHLQQIIPQEIKPVKKTTSSIKEEEINTLALKNQINTHKLKTNKQQSKEKTKKTKAETIKKVFTKLPEVDYTLCDEIIKNVLDNKLNVICTNSYKGLIISNDSKIIEFEHGLIMLKVTKTQLFSIIYEKKVTLHMDNKYISAKLFRINKEESQIILKEPVLLDFKPRDKINKRLKVDSSFKITVGFNNTHKELTPIEVSANHVIVDSNTALEIENGSAVELTMGFEIDAPSTMIIDKKFTKVFAKGTVQRVDLLKNNQRIVIEHKIQAAGQNVYKQYLQQREIAIITEFKTKMKNKL